MKEEDEIRKVLVEKYFKALKLDSLDEHCSGYTEDVRTFIGNSEAVRDNGIEAYRKRLESKPSWIKLHEPAHEWDEAAIKITMDKENPNLASATIWLTNGLAVEPTPAWFDVFSLRKENGTWKVFRLRWIPEGGAPP